MKRIFITNLCLLAFAMISYADTWTTATSGQITTQTTATKVGVGMTTAPTEKLQVSGGSILIDNNQNVKAKNSSGTSVNVLGLNSSNQLNIGSSNTSTGISSNGSTRLTINSSGNVGVGTTTPGCNLQVANNAAIGYSGSTVAPANGLSVAGNLEVGGSRISGITAQLAVKSSINTDCILNLNSTTATNQSGIEYFSAGSQNWYTFTSSNTDAGTGYHYDPYVLYSKSKVIEMTRQDGVKFLFGQLSIANDNNWTMPGSYKLAVDGKIGAREIVVTTSSWSDFVFEKDYDLKPLEDVEQFIKENGHLEGIPTEREVLENGVALGEMQTKLLQKVEELTLYVIDLKKENTKLEEKITKIENLKNE